MLGFGSRFALVLTNILAQSRRRTLSWHNRFRLLEVERSTRRVQSRIIAVMALSPRVDPLSRLLRAFLSLFGLVLLHCFPNLKCENEILISPG